MVMSTTLSLILILITVVLVLYALIVSRQRPALLFIIIPFFVYSVFYTWNITNYFKGSPLYGIPIDEHVQIITVKIDKPNIYVLLAHPEYDVPRYYVAPYNKNNEKQFNQLQQLAEGQLVAAGTFKLKPGGLPEYEFLYNLNPLPEK